MKARIKLIYLLVGAFVLSPVSCIADMQSMVNAQNSGYVASQESIKGVFDALSPGLQRSVILSKQASKKKVSGQFDLDNPLSTLKDITTQMALIWYDDGQAIYIYDADEMKKQIITLENGTFSELKDYLQEAGLYDQRYPLRSDRKGKTIYLSGPPVYIEIVSHSAQFLDTKNAGTWAESNVEVMPLYNSFVEDRHYTFRNEKMTIPGVATLLSKLTTASPLIISEQPIPDEETGSDIPRMPAFTRNTSTENPLKQAKIPPALQDVMPEKTISSAFSVIANPAANSLIVRGSSEQLAFIRKLVHSIDVPRRHIELSVWIVDLQKEALDQLGIQWSGGFNMGNNFGMSFNGASSTIDGASFMAAAQALSEKNRANIVSRPMVLTQENVPAIFDNNRTFYTKLIGERSVELQNVTYGTVISVLPRFTRSSEIEMMLNLEDGSQTDSSKTTADGLPEVGRTTISTVARVPKGKSLLIGGYTRDENSHSESKIPLLGDIPLVGGLFRYNSDRTSNMVRVFLIQPREIDTPLARDANSVIAEMKNDLGKPELQDWFANYMDGQKWH